MTMPVVTVAVWQTLLDESPRFGGEVRASRIACVRAAAWESAGRILDSASAAAALEAAASQFESAYLSGAPFDNVERVRLIAETLGLQFTIGERRQLAAQLGATHDPGRLRPRPWATQMLRELAKTHRVVALSDTWMSPGSVLRASLKHHDMADLFTAMHFSDETGASKTTGQGWAFVAQRHKASVSEIVHIGDLPDIDGKTALASGCAAAIVIEHPDHPIPMQSTPIRGVHYVTSPVAVPSLVAAWRDPHRVSH